jgi:hypothetical protein
LAYCTHVHQISFEFQNTDNNMSYPGKEFFFLFICYNLPIRAIALSEIVFTNY